MFHLQMAIIMEAFIPLLKTITILLGESLKSCPNDTNLAKSWAHSRAKKKVLETGNLI